MDGSGCKTRGRHTRAHKMCEVCTAHPPPPPSVRPGRINPASSVSRKQPFGPKKDCEALFSFNVPFRFRTADVPHRPFPQARNSGAKQRVMCRFVNQGARCTHDALGRPLLLPINTQPCGRTSVGVHSSQGVMEVCGTVCIRRLFGMFSSTVVCNLPQLVQFAAVFIKARPEGYTVRRLYLADVWDQLPVAPPPNVYLCVGLRRDRRPGNVWRSALVLSLFRESGRIPFRLDCPRRALCVLQAAIKQSYN